MEVLGLHSPSRFWPFQFIFILFFSIFFMGFQNFYTCTLQPGLRFALSNQVLGSHSPCTYLVHTLQADVGFFFFFNLNISWGFDTLTLQPGFRFILSKQMLNFFFNLNFSWGFDTLTLQPGFWFSRSMHIFGLHSPSRYWILKFVFIS